eukprot:Em0009g137a
MFSLVLFLLIGTCLGYSFGPPYGICSTFLTGHPLISATKDGTVKILLLKQGLAASCYTPGEAYTVQVTGSKQFNGILLQADSGVLDLAVNYNNLQKVACGPCDNTVSHRDKLRTTSLNFSFVAPRSGPTKVTLRYTIVFSYGEALENKYCSIAVCASPTSRPTSLPAAAKTSGVLAPSSVSVSKSTRLVTIVPTSSFSSASASTGTYTGSIDASSAPMPSPSPSIAVSSPSSLPTTPTASSTPNESTADKCNSSYYLTDERQKYVSPDDGNTCPLLDMYVAFAAWLQVEAAAHARK